jgi:hypothetical protein
LSEPQSKPNERVNGGAPQEQAPQASTSPNTALQALLEKIPAPFREAVKGLLPQIVSFIDARIEAKLNEYIPKFGEATREAIKDVIKQYLGGLQPQPQPQPQPQNQNQNQPQPQPQQIDLSQLGQLGLSPRDMIIANFLQNILGGGRRSLSDELKYYAEIKQLAETLAGGGLSPMEVFKVYRYGMLDTMRMLYLMTRKKFPLEKLLELEEEKEEEVKGGGSK